MKLHARVVTHSLCGLLSIALAGAPLTTQAQISRESKFEKTVSGKWTGRRLPDGQPDIEGQWSNTIGNHDNWTDPQGGIPGDPSRAGGGNANAIGTVRQTKPRSERAPSRVSDPADGQVPFQPWAKAKQEELLGHFFNPTSEEYIEPLARCAPAGPTKSFTWHGYEIRQFPNYVVFIFGSGTRVIHLDGKPHLPDSIKLWNADSRGHWEGNTLIVDVRNNNAKARLARTGEFASENVQITERYIFDNSGQRYTYEAIYTDPTVYTRPWTVTIPSVKYTDISPKIGWHNERYDAKHAGKEPLVESYERTCVENNAGHGDVTAKTP